MTKNQKLEREWLETHLRYGSRNATNVAVLAGAYGVSERRMLHIVKRARDNGLPVVAEKNNTSGLYLPEFDYEAFEWLALSYNEIGSHLRTTDNVSDTVVEWIRAGKIKRSCPALTKTLPPALIIDIIKVI